MVEQLSRVIRNGLAQVRVGEVTAAASGGLVSVLLDDAVLSLPVIRGYTPQVRDECLVLMQQAGGFVVGALGTAPRAAPVPGEDATKNEPPPEDSTADKPIKGSDVFRPVYTGTYRSGSWRGDTSSLYQGDWTGRGNNTGAAFYGKGPRGLRGATVTRARVKLKRLAGGTYGGVSPTLHLWSQQTRPGGSPTSVDSVSGPNLSIGESTTFQLPDTWGQRMVDGTAGGVGIRVGGSSPYVQLAGGGAIALLLDWRK